MKILLPYLALYRRHVWQMLLSLLLAIITLLASIGLLTLSGWFLAASALAGVAGLVSFNYMLPAAGVRGAAIIRTAGRYAERLVSHDATFRVLAHLRTFTFGKILPLTPGGLGGFYRGDLLNRLVADVDTLDHLYLRVLSPLCSALVITLLVTCGLSLLDTSLALTLGGIMTAMLLVLPLVFYRAGKPIGEHLTQLRADYRTEVTRWLQGHAELAVFGAQARYRDQLNETERRWLQRQQHQARLSALSMALIVALSGMTVTLMLWLAAAGVGSNSQPGALLALFVFTPLASFEALGPVASAFQHLGHVMASASRITQIISLKPAVSFTAQPTPASADAQVQINNLHFGYPNQPVSVLNDFNLQINTGEHVALLGQTGCGKSTLLQLLTRGYDAQQGQILLNGIPLEQWDEESLRKQTTVVSQRVHIFNASLRDNLTLAAPNAEDNQLREVLTQVGLANLLDDSGLAQWLGEGGRQLSGGEQRRLGIARALLHNAPLWLLDEPTEGLDAQTEQQILQLLQQYCQDKTVVMITHRLYGLENMHRICLMENGQIIEQGSHQQLVAQSGRYATLLRRQK
jgi:ATP-binding cassette subfamily C protein CydC